DPSYDMMFMHVSGIKAEAIRVPLLDDFRHDTAGVIRATKQHYRDVGFVYVCSPNNPTGRIVPKQEIKQLPDSIPENTPVMIDEGYFDFVEDPDYATSIPYVAEGRQVVVTRTFSKIAALAGMRLGYAVAPKDVIQQMRRTAEGSINAIVKWGGVAALKDTESQAQVKKLTVALRSKTTSELQSLGYSVIPSEANFFMVHLRRPVQPVIEE